MAFSYVGVPANVTSPLQTFTLPNDLDPAVVSTVNNPGPFESIADNLAYLKQQVALDSLRVMTGITLPTSSPSRIFKTNLAGANTVQMLVGDWNTAGGLLWSMSGQASTWTSRTSNQGTAKIQGGAAKTDGSIAVLVSDASGGGSGISSSVNGTAWTSRTNPTSAALNAVLWSDTLSLFVAVGASGAACVSGGGTLWSDTSFAGSTMTWLVELPGVGICAFVSNSTTYYFTSDGLTWAAHTLPHAYANNTVGISAAAGSGLFAYVGTDGHIRTSPDGLAWTDQYNPASVGTVPICHNGFCFMAVDSTTSSAWISFNGTTWAEKKIQNQNTATLTAAQRLSVGPGAQVFAYAPATNVASVTLPISGPL